MNMRMNGCFRQLLAAVGFAALLLGVSSCGDSGSAPEIERVAYSTLTVEQRQAFARAMSVSIADFDDLYGKVKVELTDDNTSGVGVKVTAVSGPFPAVEKAMGVIVSDLALRAPGIGFMEVEPGVWKLLLPEDMKVPASGTYEVRF